MLVLEFAFPGGRFHATPWGRNVVEGEPEWPPSPYRLVRALYDTWKRKRPQWPDSRVEPLLSALAAQAPRFRLPPASTSHIRVFQSKNTRNASDRSKIFDAFVVTSPGSVVLAGWPNTTLADAQADDLGELLTLLNFLGRSESWVVARLLPGVDSMDWNCIPEEGQSPGANREIVPVACPVPRDEYRPRRVKSPSRGQEVSEEGWLEALAWTTEDLHRTKLSAPPGLRSVPYLRSSRCFEVARVSRREIRQPAVNGVLYAMHSDILPSVTSTLEVAERVRRKLMGIHRRAAGGSSRVSPIFSGKDMSGRPATGHLHAYFLPTDEDRDGRLDHLLVISRTALDSTERLALDRLESIWQPQGRPDIRLVPVRWGDPARLLPPARQWVSATPFVPPRHYRKGRGEFSEWILQELRREAVHHGLPPPSRATPRPGLVVRGRSFRWIDFRRNRKGDTPDLGYGFDLEFQEPIQGPVALGYGAHFGLGLFLPRKNDAG